MDPSKPSFLLSAEAWFMALIAVQMGVPFAKWAGLELWKRITGDSETLAKKDTALAAKLDALQALVSAGFTSTNALISAENKERSLLARDVEHLKDTVDELRAELKDVRKRLGEDS